MPLVGFGYTLIASAGDTSAVSPSSDLEAVDVHTHGANNEYLLVPAPWVYDLPITWPSMLELFTVYSGRVDEFMTTPFSRLIRMVERGELHINIGKVFRLDEIVDAHQCMERNEANGKIVVLV